jgi:hypothetical protein
VDDGVVRRKVPPPTGTAWILVLVVAHGRRAALPAAVDDAVFVPAPRT